MMGKTHLAVGMAAAMAVVRPDSPAGCVAALAAGAVGGVLCDVDTLRNEGHNDSIAIQLAALGIAAALLALDWFRNLGLCALTMGLGRERLLYGAVGFGVVWLLGLFSSHRGFTHSAAAGAMFALTVEQLCPPLTLPFAAAYASHLAIDLLNRKGIRLLFPLKGRVCLGLCYADRAANALLFHLAALTTVVLVGYALIGGRL